jgi:protein O-GlcNAc transferase
MTDVNANANAVRKRSVFQNALAMHQRGQLAEAERYYREILKLDADDFDAVHLLGVIFVQRGQFVEGEQLIARALEIDPNEPNALNNRGIALAELKRFDEAVASFDKAISQKPDYAEAFGGRGNALKALKRYDEAIASYDRGISLKPDYAEAFSNRGNAFQELKRLDEAIASYKKAVALKPDYAEAFSNWGVCLEKLKRYGEALANYDKAIALNYHYAEAFSNRGVSLEKLRYFDEALVNYDKAIALKPDYAEAFSNRGGSLQKLKRFEEALANYDKAITLKPALAEAWIGRGDMLAMLKRHEDAVAAYTRILEIDPQRPFMKGILLHQKMSACAWDGMGDLVAEVNRDISSGKSSAEPFGWQGLAKSPRSLQRCAELFNVEKYPAKNNGTPPRRLADRIKIRVGYLSGEFRDQATSHLIVGVLEQHDRSRFEIFGFDNGWNDRSDIRGRIEASCLEMIDINRLSDEAAAAAVRDRQIPILVNLNGYFGEERTGVFAERAAPLQVNYLGFPGTLGAPYMDYIIADRCVIPPGHEDFYEEKVVYLPECYQANDDKKEIAPRIFSRAECGLPQQGFVYCCFNNSYKITPEVFDTWMCLLREVSGSVLWLIEDSANAVSNLKQEASKRGVNPDRLVFAPRMPLADHLARHRLADLFLDTLPYNAHTTASDALWAGLPVLTQIGGTFPGRVAASLLQAIGVPELITASQEAYQQLAIELASNSQTLATIKHKLTSNRLAKPLFNTQLFTRRIESAYKRMWSIWQQCESPRSFCVGSEQRSQV